MKQSDTGLSEFFPHRPIKDDMTRILADNPGMSREDAFLQAVFEKAEQEKPVESSLTWPTMVVQMGDGGNIYHLRADGSYDVEKAEDDS